MKKIISIIAILFCIATSYAQDTKPTKLETMDWIAEKMEEHAIASKYNEISKTTEQFRYIDYANGVITFESKRIEGDITYKSTHKFNLNFIKKMKFDEHGNIKTVEGRDAQTSIHYHSDVTDVLTYFDLDGKWSRFNFRHEANIQVRLKNAFNRLIELNTLKDKPEKF